MDRVVTKVVAFLDGGERELRWAAAKVLGALQPQDKRVIEALAKALQSDDRRLRTAALEAIQSIGASDAFEAVVPLLEEPGDVGHRAMEVVGSLGSKALPKLKRRFGAAGENGRRRMLTLAARIRGAAGMDLIVQALEAGHPDDVLEHGGRLADELATATVRERKALVTRLDKFLASPKVRGNPGTVAAAIDLLARVAGAQAQARLFEYAGADHPPRVRRRSLQALAGIAAKERLEPGLLNGLFAFLEERDYQNVVAPAMSVLERAKLAAVHAPALLACLESEDPALRRFGVTALGQVDTVKSAKALLDVLQGDNPDLKKRAAESLAKQSASVTPVVESLAKAPDAKTAWVLARILQPHSHRLEPDQVKALSRAATHWMQPGDPRAEPLLSVLRERHMDALEETVIRRVKRIRRDRDAGETINLLRPLVADGRTPSVDVRYEMAIAEVVRGRKDVVREVRLKNPGLRTLEKLLHEPDFTLLTRLKRDKSVLSPEEYYLIGCHFAERPYADRIFGGDILKWIVKTFPGDSSARAAENKLLMEGFPPPPKPRRAKKKRVAKAPPKARKPVAKKKPARKQAKKAAKKPAKKATAKKATAKKKPARKKTKAKTQKKPATKKTAKKKATKKKATKKKATKKKVAKRPAKKTAERSRSRRSSQK